MEVVFLEELNNLENVSKNINLVLGLFDGLHVGHVQLIRTARYFSNGKLAVITFDKTLKSNDHSVLLNLEDKIKGFEDLEVDEVYIIKCDENFKKLMIGNWREVPSNIKLPGRFTSDRGLLFGQYMPRFSNRIITKCPLSGEKTPNCHSREFLDFRWKSLLANMAFPDGTDLMETRRKIDDFMLLYGALSKNALKKILTTSINKTILLLLFFLTLLGRIDELFL